MIHVPSCVCGLLGGMHFIRVHQSYGINKVSVCEYRKGRHSPLMKNGAETGVSRNYAAEVKSCSVHDERAIEIGGLRSSNTS